jgi:phage recombination protein Bet
MTQKEETAVVLKDKNEIAVAEVNSLDWTAIKENIAPKLTEAEFGIFRNICSSFGLNPYKREIHAVKYGDTPAQFITGYEVYLKRAERTGMLDGWDVKVIHQNGQPVSATIQIHRKDRGKPVVWSVEREEFDTGKSTWKSMPSFMLKKVAIAQGFRLAFPDELGGMPYMPEELNKSGLVESTSEQISGSTRMITEKPKEIEVIQAEEVPQEAVKPKKASKTPQEAPKSQDAPKPVQVPEEAPEQIQEAPATKPGQPAPGNLSPETINKIHSVFLEAFKQQEAGEITLSDIETIVGLESKFWTEETHKEWLTDKYFELTDPDEPLDPEGFLALRYQEQD